MRRYCITFDLLSIPHKIRFIYYLNNIENIYYLNSNQFIKMIFQSPTFQSARMSAHPIDTITAYLSSYNVILLKFFCLSRGFISQSLRPVVSRDLSVSFFNKLWFQTLKLEHHALTTHFDYA